MSERYMIATVLEGKIADYGWCSNWTSRRLVMGALLIAAKYDGIKSIAELYSRWIRDEKYEYRKEAMEEVVTWPDELIIIDLDNRAVFFNVCTEHPYNYKKYTEWPIADMTAVIRTVKNKDPFDCTDGSGCCRNHQIPFDDFNHEEVEKYCYEYFGWKFIGRGSNNQECEDNAECEDYDGFGIPGEEEQEICDYYDDL